MANWWEVHTNVLDKIQKQVEEVQKRLAKLKEDMSDKARGKKAKLELLLTDLERQKKYIIFDTKRATRNKLNVEEEKQFETMTNKEFLKLPREQRLKYVNIWNIDYKDVEEGKEDNIQISFTFNSKFNGGLYLKTTAWQLLPPNVQEVEVLWEKWKRNWYYWEFFNTSWQRLIIHEWTEIKIIRRAKSEELKKFLEISTKTAEKYNGSEKEIVLFGLQRWLDANMAINLFAFHKDLSQMSEADKKVEIEYMITEFERAKDYFLDTFPQESVLKEGKISKEFLSFFLNYFEQDVQKRKDILKNLWFNEDDMKKYQNFTREKVLKSRWYRWMEEISPEDLNEIDVNLLDKFKKEKFWYQFVPWAKETQQLFTYAAIMSWLPKDWWKNESFHILLEKESGWIVGNLNYEFFKRGRKETTKGFKEKITTWDFATTRADELSPEMGIVSNASWLGQLLVSNVELYYPSGREWIGVPLEEAVGMLRYIKKRHKTPEQALNFHFSHNWY